MVQHLEHWMNMETCKVDTLENWIDFLTVSSYSFNELNLRKVSKSSKEEYLIWGEWKEVI